MTFSPTIGVYRITHRSSGRYYVGSSKQLPVRLAQHRNRLNKVDHHSKYLQAMWSKYGEDSFEFEVIVNCPSWSDALDIEQQMLDEAYGSRLCMNGSRKARMPILDPEVMARARRTANSSLVYIESHRRVCIERNSSPEFQARAKAALRASPAHKDAVRKNATLLQRLEVVAKNRAAIKANGLQRQAAIASAKRMNTDPEILRKNRAATCCAVVGVHAETGEVIRFSSQSDAARHLGIWPSNIAECCKKGGTTAKGYRWSKEPVCALVMRAWVAEGVAVAAEVA